MSRGGLEADGAVRLPQNLCTAPNTLLQALSPGRADVVGGGEGMLTGSWRADRCEDEGRALRPGPCPLQAGDARRQRHERPP
jgi:hypothetical protein